jgi:hypothetical protein
MTTEQADRPGETQTTESTRGASRLDWWHHSHPTFAALAGFFSGMLFVTAVPGTFVALLRLLSDEETAEKYFPLALLALLVPVLLLVRRKTRRFGTFMLIGMVLTALVVLGVTSLVLYFMVQADA